MSTNGTWQNGGLGETSGWDKSKTFTLNVLEKGANGDGITDDTVAIQSALNEVGLAGGGVVLIPPHRVFKTSGIQINYPNITLTGGGTMLNGSIEIGGGLTQKTELNFRIDGITIDRTSIVTGNNGIEIQYARRGVITNILFLNCDKAIYVRPIDSEQHSSKVKIMQNDFKNVNYCLYVDRPASPTYQWQIGDYIFSDNQAYDTVWYGHIYGLGVDGINVKGNTFFFQGNSSTTSASTKRQNIYIDMGAWIHIEGNSLFEAGAEAVLLSRCRDFQVSNNPIAWPGQVIPGSAIRIINGDSGGGNANIGTIIGNSIDYPTYHGISVEGLCGSISITGNSIRDAGRSDYYKGTTDLQTLNHFGVNVESTTQFVIVAGNVMPWDTISVLGADNYAINNLQVGSALLNSNRTLTLSNTSTTVDVTKYEQLNLNQPSATTLTGILGGIDGKVLTLVAFNGNTTLQHNSSSSDPTAIRLRDSGNAIMPTNGSITLKWTAGRWYEVSRSFSSASKGSFTFSGDGTTTTKAIPHGLGLTPTYFSAIAGNNAAGLAVIKNVVADATNITVVFNTAPASGTNNILLVWKAEL